MNPRKRRAIASMLLAGIKGEDITTTSLREFIQNNGKIIPKPPETKIIEENPVAIEQEKPKTTKKKDSNVGVVEKKKKKKKAQKKNPSALKMRFSMKNTKAELLEAANGMGITTKSSMNKQVILSLINDIK